MLLSMKNPEEYIGKIVYIPKGLREYYEGYYVLIGRGCYGRNTFHDGFKTDRDTWARHNIFSTNLIYDFDVEDGNVKVLP